MIKTNFNLETWLSNRDLVNVVTEYAEPVEIVKWNCKGKYPVLAVIYDGDTDDACFYTEDGVSISGSKLILIANEKKIKSKRILRFLGAALLLVITFLGLALIGVVLAEFITRGNILGIICSGIVLAIGGFILILSILDFIKEEKKKIHETN